MMRMRVLVSRLAQAFALAGALGCVSNAHAQDALQIGVTANSEIGAVLVADVEGIFAKNGIPAKIVIVALNPNIPAALLSNTIQIGAPSPTVLAQAIDNGLDLVAIAGVSTIAPDYRGVALAVSPASPIQGAKDLVGKTVAVPGLNAVLHVALQLWLQKNGVDPKSVRFIEASVPTMGDILKAGTVDAAIVVDPFLPRLVAANSARVVSYFFPEVAAGQQTTLYAATREWATANKTKIESFRTSLAQAAAFMKDNPDKARDDMNVYFKLPPEAIKGVAIPVTQPVLTAAQVSFWADVMKRFGLVDKAIDPAKVMAP